MKARYHTYCGDTQTLSIIFFILSLVSFNAQAFLIQEDFESDTWVSDRGWYDMGTPNVTTAQSVSGNRSLAYSFNQGELTDSNFGGMRLSLPESDSIYLSYNRMYQNGWDWGPRHDLHDFYVFADADRFQTPTDTKLTAYFEVSEGMADTILRAAQQPNSPYNDGWYHETAPQVVFESGVWHNIEAMVKMNDPGQSNGEMRMWVDGVLQVERTGLLLRAAGDEDIMFNQLFFGPYFISGSGQDQTFFTDDIIVSSEPILIPGEDPGDVVATPIPGAALLFGSAIFGLLGINKRQSRS